MLLVELLASNMQEVLERLYWLEGLTIHDIALHLKASPEQVSVAMNRHGIPARPTGTGGWYGGGRVVRRRSSGQPYWYLGGGSSGIYEHIEVMKQVLGKPIADEESVHHKDGNSLNNHYLNLECLLLAEHGKTLARPSLYAIYMGLAYLLSGRSTCSRAKTGAVVTSHDLSSIYAVGYNGNASGMPNSCDSDEVGKCGCIHSEENALIKVQARDGKKVMFATTSPCLKCAKLIINSGFSWVFYGEPYRHVMPLSYLHYAGVKTCPYPIYTLPYSTPLTVLCHPVSGDALCPCGCGRLLKDTGFEETQEKITPELLEKTYGKLVSE